MKGLFKAACFTANLRRSTNMGVDVETISPGDGKSWCPLVCAFTAEVVNAGAPYFSWNVVYI